MGWDHVPQVTVTVGGSSVLAGVMAMISDLGVKFFKGLKANMTLGCLIVTFPFLTGQRFHRLFRKHVVKPSCFFFDVVAKHLYTILASVKFQWIFNWPMSKLAADAKARWNVVINLFGVWFVRVRTRAMYWSKNGFKVCIHCEWHLSLVLPIMEHHE